MGELRINQSNGFSTKISEIKNDDVKLSIHKRTDYFKVTINREQAIQIIQHLQDQFQIKK